MAVFTKLSERDIERVSGLYGIDFSAFKAESGGSANTNYRLESVDGKQFMLTISEDTNAVDTRRLVDLLEWLFENDFETSRALLTLENKRLAFFQGKPMILKRLIPGEVVENLTDEMLVQAGSKLARLHLIRPPNFLPEKHPFGIELFSTVFEKNIEPEFEHWLKNQTAFITNHFPKKLPRGIIHGDLFEDNILFENGNLTAIIDFEVACHYPLAFDLGMSFIGLCQTNEVIDLTKTKAFLVGYERIRKIEDAEKRQLNFFTNYAATSIAFWRFRQYRVLNFYPERKNKHLQMVKLVKDLETKIL